MVTVCFSDAFRKKVSRISDIALKTRIKKQIHKITNNQELGKPMRYSRKGTRELYIPPFRLSYLYNGNEDKLILLELYHKKKQ